MTDPTVDLREKKRICMQIRNMTNWVFGLYKETHIDRIKNRSSMRHLKKNIATTNVVQARHYGVSSRL